jgi:hypothetical protein
VQTVFDRIISSIDDTTRLAHRNTLHFLSV